MRRTIDTFGFCLLLAICAGCSTTKDKLVFTSAPKENERGSRVEGDSGFGQKFQIEEVGGYVSIPRDWAGPVPPGWTSQDPAILIAKFEAQKAEAEARKAEALRFKAAEEKEIALLEARKAADDE